MIRRLAIAFLIGLAALILFSCKTVEDCFDVAQSCSPPCRVNGIHGKCVCECPKPEVSPEPSPSPVEPSPVPTPEPTPTPAPTPRPCALPPMPECGGPETAPGVYGCCIVARPGERGQFQDDVEAVVSAVASDTEYVVGGTVLDAYAFRLAVKAGLRERGLCAVLGGPEDEIGVKGSNVYSEQYDIITGSGKAWVGYAAVCRPSRF